MSGALKGACLGLANTVVIGLAFGIQQRDSETAVWVVMFGLFPAMVLGVALGTLASWLARRAVWLRRALLALPAFGLVYMLAEAFWLVDQVAVAMIPTLVATSILERWTRWREPPPLPVAQLART